MDIAVQELDEVRLIGSKSRVQQKIGEQGLEKATARATKAEARALEAETALATKSDKWAKKLSKLEKKLADAGETIKSLEAQAQTLLARLNAQERDAEASQKLLAQELQEMREEAKRRKADHARVVDR